MYPILKIFNKCQEQTDYFIFSNNCLSDAIELYNRFNIIVCQNPSKGNKTKNRICFVVIDLSKSVTV